MGRYTKQNPDAKVDCKVEWRRSTGNGLLHAAVSGEWVHGQYMNNYCRDPIPNAFVLDFSVRMELQTASGARLVPYCLLRNFLNRQYEYIKNYPMPGINLLAGLQLEL